MATPQQVRDLITQTTSGTLRPRVPREVRDEVCRYAARRRREGAPWAVIARETGLETRKLQRWRPRARRAAPVPVLRPVEVVSKPEVTPDVSPPLALVAPSGLCIEGLQLDQAAQLEIAHLKEQLANRTKALFGDSSERRPCTEHKNDERKEPRRGHGPREQKVLPIVEVIHELDEPDQACPSCGGDLQPMAGQFEEADEIDVDSSTLWEQTWHLSRHLLPTYEANHEHVLSADVIGVVETWWRLMKKGASKRSWVWSVAREDAVSYRLLSSRSTEAARTVLGEYVGVAICDGYKAYDALSREREGSDLTLARDLNSPES